MHLTKESELPDKFDRVIKPWFDEQMESGFCLLSDGASLHYRYAHNSNARSVIVISSGRVECAAKYGELIYDLHQNGHSVFIHDHRGQGLSTRLEDNPHFGYIASFRQYIDDFSAIIDTILLPMLSQKYTNEQPRLYLLCHSMGSAVGALLVKSRPNLFSKAIFCSPMFGITPPLPPWIANIVVKLGVLVNRLRGRKTSYFFGQGDYKPTAFYKNRLMSSKVRYQIFRRTYAEQPALQLGGVTFEWIYASLAGMKEIRRDAKQITTRCLILYSGADTVVANDDIKQVINDMMNCESELIPEALHELFFEKDKFRTPALKKVLGFIGTD